MKKLIGIPAWSLDKGFGVTTPYLNYFDQFGKVRILVPDEGIDADIDMIVLPGGMDLDSSQFNTKPSYYNSNIDTYKNFFFKNNLPQYIAAGKSVFGICLGFQQINVHFGGSLDQHCPTTYSNAGRHEEVDDLVIMKDKIFPFHAAMTQMGLRKDLSHYKTNSMHHQLVWEDGLGKDLIALAFHRKFDHVEALYHNSLPIAGVQWHPEEMHNDPLSACIIKTLLK